METGPATACKGEPAGPTVVHRPWKGELYQTQGLRGLRCLVLGYSHWLGKCEQDSACVTTSLLSGQHGNVESIAFFATIAKTFRAAFGQSLPDFYDRVAFMNFVPSAIGGKIDRYAKASDHQKAVGQGRFLAQLKKLDPHVVIVFSRKAWRSLPPSFEDGQRITRPRDAFGVDACTYRVGDRTIPAYGLRHPQGASHDRLSEALKSIPEVQEALKRSPR